MGNVLLKYICLIILDFYCVFNMALDCSPNSETENMIKNSYNYPLLEGFAKLAKLPWYGITAIVTVLLLMLLVLVAYLEDSFTNSIDWSFW